MTLFVQLYESNADGGEERDRDVLRGVSRTAMVFGNTYNGAGYDLVLVGQVEPMHDRRRRDRRRG